MKIRTIIVSLTATLCLVGCSKDGGSSSKTKRLVPATAAEVTASSDYKLEHTTKTGIKLYVRELTPAIAKTITEDSPDHEFLNGDDQSAYYFLVMIRDGKIVDTDAATAGALKPEDTGEIMGFTMKRDKKMQEMLRQATKK
jgi:major membrane immunogen (membrane-anchored lipoprotein)